MTVGRISLVCWTVFIVMCLAFLPLAAGIYVVAPGPHAVRLALAAVVVLALWWGPFGYAMYLSLAVVRNGDKRLLARGIAGTAVVLEAKRTNEVIQSGEFAWEAPRVWKYRLRVSVPGKEPYETDCRICAPGIRQGATVRVAVSPRNRKRVTIDPGSLPGTGTVTAARGPAGARLARMAGAGPPAGGADATGDRRDATGRRLDDLARLGQLHSQGVLTDAEFAAEKAKILGE